MKKKYLWIHFGIEPKNIQGLDESVLFMQNEEYLESLQFKSIYKDYSALILTKKDTTISDTMKIEDHINYSGKNPLMGKNHNTLGPRFPDMSTAYSYTRLNMNVTEKLKNTIICAGNLFGEDDVFQANDIVYQAIVCNHQGISPSAFLLKESEDMISFINKIIN